ncbi:MAG TPA: peptidoglycan-binding domain-containing protein [Gemmatimonadaceae bacterium]|nr:peptidoglycan-binding domain-containing protein [Gemmatimonadaceae bacterium]
MRRQTIAVLALALVPAMAAAQQDSTRSGGQSGGQSSADRQRGNDDQPTMAQDSSARRGRTRGEAAGSLTRGGRGGRGGNMGLDRDQVEQLQQALADQGCDPGTVDGLMGPRTRRAIACARQQLNVGGNDMNELYQRLNLNFGDESRRGGRQGQGTEDNQGRVRPPADSAGASDSTGMRSPRAAQEGRGMHDSTTSTNRPRPGADTSSGMGRDSSAASRDSLPRR